MIDVYFALFALISLFARRVFYLLAIQLLVR